MKSLFNWYLIQDDPFSILLPLITQDIFNLMIKIYQNTNGSTISIADSGIEFFGFLKSCIMILLAICKALLSMVDIVSGKATLCAVVTGSALFVSTSADDFFGDYTNDQCECEECELDCDLDIDLDCGGGGCCDCACDD